MVYDTLFGLGRSMSSVTEGAMDPEIEAITMESVEECAGDPFEFATAIMYENEMAMQNLDMAVMCCEYAYLKENGTEMVYEAGVLKNFFESAKKKVKEWWEKIVKFFKKVFNYVANFVRTDAQFVKKYEEAAKKAGTVSGLEFEGYNYDPKVPEKMISTIGDAIEDVDADSFADNESVTTALDTLRGAVCKDGNSSAASSIKAEDFSDELDKALRGGAADKVDIKSFDCVKAIAEIKDAKNTKKHLQAMYDVLKKMASTMIATMKMTETEVDKEAKKDDDAAKTASKAAHNAISAISSMRAMATLVCNKGAKMITASNRQNRAFLTKALAKANGKKDDAAKTSVGESAYADVFAAFGV